MAQCSKFMAFWGYFEPFWIPLDGNVRREKRFQHISLGVTYLDPAIWGLQGRLWPNFPNLWQFGAILSPSGAPRWQCRKGKKVPTHRPGCDLPWSNLDPPWSSHLGSPGLLMVRNGIFGHKWCQKWHFLAINTTQNVEKVWAVIGSPFSTIRLTRKMQKLFQNRNFF